MTHEHAAANEAGRLKVEVGFRNRGGQHLWNRKGPDITLSVKTAFYSQPLGTDGETGVPVYETNWQPLAVPRGATVEYKAVCPKTSARYYQVTVSDVLK